MGWKTLLVRRIWGERRKHPRAQLRNPLFLNFNHASRAVSGFGETLDISLGGICFLSYIHIPKKAPLKLKLRCEFSRSDVRDIWLESLVLRCQRKPEQRRYRIACMFEKPDAAVLETLHAFILNAPKIPEILTA